MPETIMVTTSDKINKTVFVIVQKERNKYV